MGYLAAIFLTIIALIVFFPVFRNIKKELEQIHNEALDKMDHFLQEIDNPTAFTFYTNKHPYVWCKTNLKDIQMEVQKTKYSRQLDPRRFTIKIDHEKKLAYFVQHPFDETFDWDNVKLVHYEEWIKNKKPISEERKS